MRYLGIDYGTKRVGVALSDESGTLAFAHSVVAPSGAVVTLLNLIKDERVGSVVLGESLDFKNKPNPLMAKIAQFKRELEEAGVEVVYEPELMTSAQANRNPMGEKKTIASPAPHRGISVPLDSSAAALILQSYLDKKGNAK